MAAIGGIPVFIVYSMLSSVMPRTGGDYVFQSRATHPALGFTIVGGGYIFFMFGWFVYPAWYLASSSLTPLLGWLGETYGNPVFMGVASWFMTADGLVLAGTLMNVLAFIVIIMGLRAYVRLQYLIMATNFVAWVIMMALFATNTPTTFTTSLDSYALKFLGESNFVEKVISEASSIGYYPKPAFSWHSTLSIMALFWMLQMWNAYAVCQLGEIRGAENFKLNLRYTLGASWLNVFIVCTLLAVFFNTVTEDFWTALCSLGYEGILTLTIAGQAFNIPALSMILTSNPILIGLITLGFALHSFQIAYNAQLGGTRVTFAATFDRLLPSGLARVYARFTSPIGAALMFAIGGELAILIYNYVRDAWTYILSIAFTSVLIPLFTTVAGIVFPYRSSTKEIYKTSPISKYRVGNVPAISVVGVLGLIFQLICMYFYLTVEAFGIIYFPSVAVIIGAYVAFAIWFYAAKWYRSRQGIDVDLAYRQIPPA